MEINKPWYIHIPGMLLNYKKDLSTDRANNTDKSWMHYAK